MLHAIVHLKRQDPILAGIAVEIWQAAQVRRSWESASDPSHGRMRIALLAGAIED
jgi:hypothetical protein